MLASQPFTQFLFFQIEPFTCILALILSYSPALIILEKVSTTKAQMPLPSTMMTFPHFFFFAFLYVILPLVRIPNSSFPRKRMVLILVS